MCRDVHAQKSRADDVAILVPTTDAYEMGAQGKLRKKVDAIFTKAQHAALAGNHVYLGLTYIYILHI